MEPAALKYRPDIDGLRALAILPVVWFHSDLPGAPGGFTGVDTFFVISGYLITLIIDREVAAGNFSISHFYRRRVRRIAPALLLVLGASTAAALALLLPYELKQFAHSDIAALAMAANIYFWHASGYFALADAVTPLLHTWSLGVEEQFYIFFPPMLLIAERMGVKRGLVAIIALASVAASMATTALWPAAAFYMLPWRAWELMTGAALAIGLVRIPARSWVALTGLILLLVAALTITGEQPYPSWRAVIPVAGAALLIGSGPTTPVARLLATAPLVYVGRISYSFYLWHWPVFVFMRQSLAEPHLTAPWAIFGIALSVVLASASYHYVEQPARLPSVPFKRVAVLCAGVAAIILIVVCSMWSSGLPERWPSRSLAAADGRNDRPPYLDRCAVSGRPCRLGRSGQPRFLLMGDSHSAAIAEAVEKVLQRPGLLVSMGTCPPAAGWARPILGLTTPPACAQKNRQTLAWAVSRPSVHMVILSAYWGQYERVAATSFWSDMQKTVDQLDQAGKQVVVVGGIPDPGVDVPWASAIRSRFGRPPLRLSCPPANIPLRRAEIVDVSSGFCRGQPPERLFIDSNHVSRFGGETIIAPALRRALVH